MCCSTSRANGGRSASAEEFNSIDILKSSNVSSCSGLMTRTWCPAKFELAGHAAIFRCMPSGGSNKLAWIRSKYLQDLLWPKPDMWGNKKKCIEKSQHRCLTSKSKLQKSVWPCEGFPPLSAWATAPREGFCQTIKDYVQLQGVFSKCFKAFQEFSSHLHQPFRFLIFCVFFVPKLEQWHKKPGTPRTPEHWKKTYYQGMAKTISMSFK